jgi:type II secretory pathway pseudopilin PulG
MRVRSILLGGVCVGALALMPGLSMAQSASDADKVDQLQRQMDALQQQMRSLKGEIAQAKKKSVDQDSLQNAYGADAGVRSKSPLVKASPIQQNVHITLGGFFAGETVWRQRNLTSDESDNFATVPFPFQPTFNENEFRASGRATRITFLAEGNIDPKRKLSGYFETDFYGVGATSNYNQSNSWAPRIRQGYVTYDDNNSGFHMLSGQAWSLLTQNTMGIAPRKENIPLTIEHNYVVGFEFTRNWQARFVQEFGPMWTAGVSLEAPAELVFTGTGGIASGGIFNGVVVNFANAGGAFLGSSGIANTFTTDKLPDIVEKVAFDPGWAHFEVFGLQRFFTDNVFNCITFSPVTGVCAAGSTGSASEKTKTGVGIGGSFLWPILPSFLDLSGQAMAGKGIGRYNAGNLSDVVVGQDGSFNLFKEVSAMGGVVLHPWSGLDIYGYGGFEQESANFYSTTVGGFPLGLGNPNFSNAGCNVTTAISFSLGSAAAGNCASNTKMLTDITVGFWQNLYNGDVGRFTFGLQWERIGRKLFDGNAIFPPVVGPGPTTAPSSSDNIIMTSIRWFPKYPTY